MTKNPLREQGVWAELPTNSLPTPTAPAWFAGVQSRRFLQHLMPSMRLLLTGSCELLATEQDRLIIAVPSNWMPVLTERRKLLEQAASRAMGRPIAVDLIATDAQPAGGAQ